MSFEFPYRFRKFNNKQLAYPEVMIQLNTFIGKQTFYFIFDSGADITTLPTYMIDVLELSENDMKKSKSFGISLKPVESWEATIPVKIESLKFDLPVTFIPNKDVPFLLGKEGIFDKFNIVLDNDAEKTVFHVR